MDIEKDVVALEHLLQAELKNYHGTATRNGRKWYGLGLEDNASDNQKDSASKRGILGRMIDAVLGFIGRILKRIKDFFFVDKETLKANAEFAKTYKGPTDEDLAKSVNKYAKDNSKATGNDKPDQVKPTGDTLKDTIAKAERVTGQRIDVAKAKEFFNGEKMALISAMLSNDRMAVVSAMMDDKFADSCFGVLDDCVKLFKHRNDLDDSSKLCGDISKGISECKAVIDSKKTLGERELKADLSKWVMYKDSNMVDRMHDYFMNTTNGVDGVIVSAKDYLEETEDSLKSLRNINSNDEIVARIKQYEEIIKSITGLISLSVMMSSSYNTVLRGLRK